MLDLVAKFYSGKQTYLIAFFISYFLMAKYHITDWPRFDSFLNWSVEWVMILLLFIYGVYVCYVFPIIFNKNVFEPISKWDLAKGPFGRLMRYIVKSDGGRVYLMLIWIFVMTANGEYFLSLFN